MKKLYEKNELNFAIVWIVVYCALQSLANPLNKAIGVAYAASAAFCVVQTVVLFTFIRKNGLQQRDGLCRPPVPSERTTCRSCMGFVNHPFLHVGSFTMCRCLSWHREISGTVSLSITRLRLWFVVLCVCSASDSWRK